MKDLPKVKYTPTDGNSFGELAAFAGAARSAGWTEADLRAVLKDA